MSDFIYYVCFSPVRGPGVVRQLANPPERTRRGRPMTGRRGLTIKASKLGNHKPRKSTGNAGTIVHLPTLGASAGMAHTRLGHAIEALNELTPCAGSISEWWISEDAELRSKAAELCGGCPVLIQCRTYAHEAGERFNVWAGVDLTHHPKIGRPRKAPAA